MRLCLVTRPDPTRLDTRPDHTSPDRPVRTYFWFGRRESEPDSGSDPSHPKSLPSWAGFRLPFMGGFSPSPHGRVFAFPSWAGFCSYLLERPPLMGGFSPFHFSAHPALVFWKPFPSWAGFRLFIFLLISDFGELGRASSPAAALARR